jgi:radical SAM pair-associated protein
MFKFSKELYPKEALILAAYSFTDMAYVHLDADNDSFYVDVTPKAGKESLAIDEFKNEMLAQTARLSVYSRTKNIREMLIARSVASSMIVNGMSDSNGDQNIENDNSVFQDWFTDNE